MKKLLLILMVGSFFSQEENQIIENQYQITASTTLENLAIDKKSEQKFIGGVLLAGSGALFSLSALPLFIKGIEFVTVVSVAGGVIVGGIGILNFRNKSILIQW